MPGPEKNYYQILQVDANASQAVIQGAYRALLKNARLHPDLGGSETETQAVNEAYQVLKDPEKRLEYDRSQVFNGNTAPRYTKPQYILICPSCSRRNLVRDESILQRAKCGVCKARLMPKNQVQGEQEDVRAFRLGTFMFDKGLYDRALAEFKSATRLKPRRAKYHYWVGRCYYQKHTFDSARAEFQMAMSLKSGQFHYHFWLGQTQFAQKDFSGALAAFKIAAGLREKHLPTETRLGSCYYRLKHYEKAIEIFREIHRREPTRLQPINFIGLSLLALKNFSEAFQAFQKAEKITPGNAFIKKKLSLCEKYLGKYAREETKS